MSYSTSKFLFPCSIFFFIFFMNCNKHIKPELDKPVVARKLLSLNKSSCFGKCPVYKITIYSDGLSILESKLNMNKIGLFHSKLSEEQLESITRKINKVQWPESRTRFMKNIPDLPVSTISFYKQDSLFQRIESNSTLPQDLESIHTDLSDLANQSKWILAMKEKEFNSKDIIKDELQIDMDSTIQAATLEKIFQPYNFTMKSRISEYMNFYLFTYDTQKISPLEMVVFARQIKGVRFVSFNKKLQLRDE
ncbi:MAG: hypothetical protein HOP11_13745 [Saprospiraceae bacterium]|nr:hypothetical protein [Saprospiraceae bacterium]